MIARFLLRIYWQQITFIFCVYEPYHIPRRLYRPEPEARLETIAEELISERLSDTVNNNTIMAVERGIVTNRDLITEARSVPVFRGTDSFELTHFINEVETITALATEENLKAYLDDKDPGKSCSVYSEIADRNVGANKGPTKEVVRSSAGVFEDKGRGRFHQIFKCESILQ